MSKNLLDFNKDRLNFNKGIIKKDINSADDIAIIGMCVKLPMADNIEEFWNNTAKGVDCIRKIPESRKRDIGRYISYHQSEYKKVEYSELGYLDEIDKFDYNFFGLSPKEASLMDPNQRLFLQVAWNAIEDAGYIGKGIKGSKTGVYVGFSGELRYGKLIDEFEPLSKAVSIPGNIVPIIASRISYVLDLKGPSVILDTACSSSLVAVHVACNALRSGECNMALAGGVKINLLPLAGSIALDIESSDGRTRAFDDSSDGSGLGEGVAAILLKPLNKAIEDGDNIYAVIKGSSINQDGSSIGITAPNPKAQEDAIVQAWKDAGIEPETISYIEAHGTGTRLGDPIEIDGIEGAFQRYTDRKQFCAIGTVKTNIGHLENASGIVGLIKAVLALKNRKIPPTINFAKPNRKINFHKSPVYINNTLTEWETEGTPRRCGVSSFGLGGTNCHMVLEEFKEAPASAGVPDKRTWVFTISARCEEVLKVLIKNCALALINEDAVNLDDICFTSNIGRDHYNHRIAIITDSLENLKSKLDRLSRTELDIRNNDDIYYGKFKLLAINKEIKEANERIEEEINNFSKAALINIKEFVASGYKAKGLLDEICRMYINGADVAWEELYQGQKRKRVKLPVYPFEPLRCWIEIPENPNSYETNNDSKLYYQTRWDKKEISNKISEPVEGCVLIFGDETGISWEVASQIRESGSEVIEIEFGESFEKVSSSKYILNGNKEEYERLIKETQSKRICRILHFSTIKMKKAIDNMAEMMESQKRGVHSLRQITAVLGECGSMETIEVLLISEYVNGVTGSEMCLNPENATLFGFGKALTVGNSIFKVRCIDTDDSITAQDILVELNSKDREYMVAYRDRKRYIELIEELDVSSIPMNGIEIKKEGVYVITGGIGRLGLEMGKYLSSKANINLVLINRSKFPEREDWENIKTNSENKNILRKVEVIQEIEQRGSKVRCVKADITVQEDLKQVIDRIKSEYGKIDGIIHSAAVGVGRWEESSGDQNAIRFEEELQPKVYGTWLIDHLTKEENIDFLVLFSSVMTIIGGIGAEAYTSANSYLDSFSNYRSREGRKTLTVNWPTWKNTTTSIVDKEAFESKQIFKIINTDEAVNAFDVVLKRCISRAIIGRLNFDSPVFELEEYLPFRLSNELRNKYIYLKHQREQKVCAYNEIVKLTGRNDERYTDMEKMVGQVWASQFGTKEINIYDSFYELGGNSIIAVKIISILNSKLCLDIEVTDLSRYPNFCEFTQYVGKVYKKGLVDESIYTTMHPVEKKDYYPVTLAQKRILLQKGLEHEDISHNNSLVMMIQGKLDITIFEEVFKKLIERHEVLRTSFQMKDNEWVQRVHAYIPFEIKRIRINNSRIDDVINDLTKPFDLAIAPLFMIYLVELEEDKYILKYEIDNIISDNISIIIIRNELIRIFNGEMLPRLEIQYKDYSVWQNELIRKHVFKKQEVFWKSVINKGIPILNLPLDYPGRQKLSNNVDKISFKLSTDEVREIKGLALETGSLMHIVLLSAFNIMLLKYSNQEDIAIGYLSPIRKCDKLENVIGLFEGTLIIRSYPQRDKTFREFLREVKENLFKVNENSDYPLDLLVGTQTKNIDVGFFYQNAELDKFQTEDLAFTFYKYNNTIAPFNLLLNVIERENELELELEYRTDLFKRSTIETMAVQLQNLLNECVIAPDHKLMEIVSKDEKLDGEIKDIKQSCQSTVDAKIQNSTKLLGIKPFNEVFYKNCFYNSLFPVIRYYNKSILPFLINDIITYNLINDNNTNLLNIDYINLKSIETIANDVGINVNWKVYKSNIIEDIIASISCGSPVIIWVDCFYESIRSEFYQKSHYPHTWLIIGYDINNRMFTIIEHMHKDNLTYREYMVSFNDLLNCYEGFLNNYLNGTKNTTYYEFHLDKNNNSQQSIEECRCIFLDNISKQKESIFKGLESLSIFISWFEQVISNKSAFYEYAVNAQNSLNNIINVKKVERYRIAEIFQCMPEIIINIDSILDDWNFVRNRILKSVYMRSYKDDKLIEVVKRLKNIYRLECETNSKLI